MLFKSAAHPGKSVRLAYCMNLHAAETLEELLENMRRITLPLRERLAKDREFGVGMYLPAVLARELANDAAKLAQLKHFLDEHALDPFTYNAFPFGGFQTDGLKERVFEPTWGEQARLDFTLDVANVATRLSSREGGDSHISISTHCGAHSSHFADPEDRQRKTTKFIANFKRVAKNLAALESRTGRRVVLSLEPEPRSSCNDTAELSAVLGWKLTSGDDVAARHIGVCFDTCHAAVEFEPMDLVLMPILGGRLAAGLGKLQFSSALALREPAANNVARERLFNLDEPRFLHQVTANVRGLCLRVGDIPEARRAWERDDEWWRDASELRCHFHVPVDAARIGDEGLTTTRDYADEELRIALARPVEWRKPELHVEIETYTWDVLPRGARGTGELVDGLEREYRHVIAQLEKAGWRMA